MFDIGWSELLLIGIVALLVVPPKDLPGMFRTAGQWLGSIRRMARDFQRTMEDAAGEAGLKDAADIAGSLKNVGRAATGGVSGLAKYGVDEAKKSVDSVVKSADDAMKTPSEAPGAPTEAPEPSKTAESPKAEPEKTAASSEKA